MNPLNKAEPFTFCRSGTYSVQDNLNGNSSGSVGSSVLWSGTSTVTGYANPGWRDQVKQGINATTTFIGVKYSGSCTWASYQAQGVLSGFHSIKQEVYGNSIFNYPIYPSTGVVPSSTVTDVTNRCIRKFIQEANQALSSDNLTGRSIKHLSHDLHAITHPMNDLRTKISSYLSTLEKASKGVNKKSKSWLRVIRNEYLQFTFGTAPFVDDITSILVDASHKRFPSVPINASASGRYAVSNGTATWSSLSNFTLGFFQSQYNVTSVYSVRMKGAIRTNSGMDGKIGLIQSQRLLPQDWLPTAFSILPYAWMVDYFTNIGDIIDGLSFPWSYLAWGCVNTKAVNTVTYSDPTISFNTNGASPWTGQSAQGNGGSAEFRYEQVTRNILTPSDLLPRFELKVPTSPKQWLNMMAVFQPRIAALIL
jgi:hypothetical protein